MGLLSLLGLGNKSEKIAEYLTKGAIIIDVRTTGEFASGHISGSKNIPLDIIAIQAQEIKKLNQSVIVCCRSGLRSSQAAGILKQNGIDVLNGGGWESLQKNI